MDPLKEKMGIKGFTVQFSQNPMVVPIRGSVLVFDQILSNVDKCYQGGVFTAPKTGIYSFYFSGMLATDDYKGYTDLVIEKVTGDPIQRVFLRAKGDIFVGSQGSFHVRCRLERGEQVRVRHLDGDLGMKGKSNTTFSGVMEFEYTDTVKRKEEITAKTVAFNSVKSKVFNSAGPSRKFSK